MLKSHQKFGQAGQSKTRETSRTDHLFSDRGPYGRTDLDHVRDSFPELLKGGSDFELLFVHVSFSWCRTNRGKRCSAWGDFRTTLATRFCEKGWSTDAQPCNPSCNVQRRVAIAIPISARKYSFSRYAWGHMPKSHQKFGQAGQSKTRETSRTDHLFSDRGPYGRTDLDHVRDSFPELLKGGSDFELLFVHVSFSWCRTNRGKRCSAWGDFRTTLATRSCEER